MGFFDSTECFKKKKTPLRESTVYEIELDITDKGSSFVNGKEYPHAMGNLIIGKPGSKRQSIQPYLCYYIHFSCNDREFEEKYLKPLPDFMKVPDFEKMKNLINNLIECIATDGTENTLYTNSAFLLLISEIFRINEQQRISGNRYLNLQKNIFAAQQFAQQNFDKKILVSDLAEKAHLSPNYFLTVFRKITGQTPNKYITNLRLAEAKKRLVNSADCMDKIAEDCGFDTQAYMCYVFQKELGISPKGYRDLYRRFI